MLDQGASHWPMYELSAFLFFLGPMLIIVILYVRMGVTIRSRMIKFPGETKHLDSRTKPIIRMLGKVDILRRIVRWTTSFISLISKCYVMLTFSSLSNKTCMVCSSWNQEVLINRMYQYIHFAKLLLWSFRNFYSSLFDKSHSLHNIKILINHSELVISWSHFSYWNDNY